MPFTLRNSHRFRLLLLLMLVVVSAVLISARWKPGSQPNQSAPETQLSPAQETRTQPEAELITITPTGFEPDQISRPQGPFILAVDNRSGLDEVGLYLERETGSRTDVQPSRKRKLAWREIVDLPAGRYVLRAADHNDWRCTITVTPR